MGEGRRELLGGMSGGSRLTSAARKSRVPSCIGPSSPLPFLSRYPIRDAILNTLQTFLRSLARTSLGVI